MSTRGAAAPCKGFSLPIGDDRHAKAFVHHLQGWTFGKNQGEVFEMKHTAKKRWAIDIEITADRSGLSCQDVIDYTRKLYAAISAGGNLCGVKPYIGDEFYHEIHIWGRHECNIGALIMLCSEMAAAGCAVEDMRGFYERYPHAR